jgi:hypothetical protein
MVNPCDSTHGRNWEGRLHNATASCSVRSIGGQGEGTKEMGFASIACCEPFMHTAERSLWLPANLVPLRDRILFVDKWKC